MNMWMAETDSHGTTSKRAKDENILWNITFDDKLIVFAVVEKVVVKEFQDN